MGRSLPLPYKVPLCRSQFPVSYLKLRKGGGICSLRSEEQVLTYVTVTTSKLR